MAPFSKVATPRCGASLLALIAMAAAQDQVVRLDELVAELNDASNSNKKVGFLAQANYDSVHTVLPSGVQAVICDDSQAYFGVTCSGTQDMIDLIKNGTLLAGLISGLPEADEAPFLNTFSSTVVSTRAMFMAPDQSTDHPHGAVAANSSYELSLAVDAAIVSLQVAGKDEEARLANMPFEFMAVHTCKGSDLTAFGVPNHGAATGLLRDVLDSKILKIGALGPYDWGGNDGNYNLDPPVGFYPDWLTWFCQYFNDLAGPDGVKYDSAGTITCERVYQLGSAGVFADLFDGRSHVTEPYYIIDSFYTGTSEACTTDDICRPAHTSQVSTGREQCVEEQCTHPSSPRKRHFRSSCSTIGVDSTFMTKKHAPPPASTAASAAADDELDTGIIIALACLGVVVVCCGSFLVFVIHREKRGRPMFSPLVSSGSASPGVQGDKIGEPTM